MNGGGGDSAGAGSHTQTHIITTSLPIYLLVFIVDVYIYLFFLYQIIKKTYIMYYKWYVRRGTYLKRRKAFAVIYEELWGYMDTSPTHTHDIRVFSYSSILILSVSVCVWCVSMTLHYNHPYQLTTVLYLCSWYSNIPIPLSTVSLSHRIKP